MKTTLDLPEDLVQRAKIAAAKRNTTFKNLVVQGLEQVLSKNTQTSVDDALARLKMGMNLGGGSAYFDRNKQGFS